MLGCGYESTPSAEVPSRAAVMREDRVSPTTVILQREDGTFTAVITAAPHAFRDGERWRPIDTTLRRTGSSAVADQNLVVARLPARLGEGHDVRFEDRQSGVGFSWRPRWPGPSDDLQLEGERARYPLGGSQVGAVEEFQVLRGAVKHNLVLGSADALERVLVETSAGLLAVGGDLTLDPGLRLQPADDGVAADGSFVTLGAIDVIGPRGTLLELPAPRAFELGGARRSVGARYRWSSTYKTLSVEVDAAWLRASDRFFPLAIDPPATVLSSYTAQVLAGNAAGPGTLVSGPDAIRLGALSFAGGVNEFYQVALKFDVSAISAATTISAVSVNVFYATTGSNNSQVLHFARLTRDPQTTDPAPMWIDGEHLANPDYAVLPTQANNCGCWINGGTPATQSGSVLGPIAVADLQASLPSGRFLLGMHVPTYVTGQEAEPHGLLQPNEPQLYVDFTTGLPSVSTVTPAFTPVGTALTTTVLGTNFTGQAGTTASLVPILGGPSTPVAVTYLSAGRIRISVPTTAPIGVYDVVVTTSSGSSAVTPGDRFAVLAPASRWNGSVSTAWSNGSNWTPAGVPDLTTDVTIPGATPFSPTNDVVAGARVHALTIAGGTLSTGGWDLTVTEDLSINSGALDMTSGGTLFLSGNNFLSAGTFIPGTGTVNFASQTRGRQNFVATGKVFFDDFERAGPGWTAAINSGAPNAWALTEKYVFSPISAWYQQGKQNVAGSATIASPSFSLAGKTSATLRWKHRYRINLEDNKGPNSGDGFVVQVSVNGGASWATIAPHLASVGPRAMKATGATCSAGGARTLNPVAAGPAGIFAGIQSGWIQDSVSLTPQAGQADVRVRFWSGWDNCNDFVPSDGVYVDDVSVTADETTLAFNHLTLSNSAQVTAITALQVNGNLNVSTANNQLDVNGAGLTVLGTGSNAGTLLRGPSGAFSVTGAFINSGTVSLGSGPVTTGLFTNSGTTTGGSGDLTTAGLTNSGTLSTGILATVVNGDLSITAGSVLIRGASLAVTGNISNNGTLDTGGASTSLTGAVATTVTGAGQYKQSATRQVLFSDGFESGNLSTGGWVATAGGAPPDTRVVATPPGGGSFVANLPAGEGWVDNWLTKALSTAGQSGIWLTFGRATTMTAGSYTLKIEYSLDSGASWKTAKSIPGTFSYVFDAINLSALDPAVDDNAGFQFRFFSNRQFTGNYHYIDDVRLEAGTAGLGPLTISGGGTKTINPTNAAAELVVAGPVTLSAGTMRVVAGKNLSLAAPVPVTSTSAAGTLLDIEPNATLKLSGNTTLSLTGTLELLGLVGLPAKVTTTDPVTPGRYALNVSGTFNGGIFDLDSANALGLNLAVGCAVTALNDGNFHRPPSGGALLTLGTTTPPAVSTGCSFANELGATGASSVDGSLNGSAIRFDRATGALAGENFDRDFGAATPGNVTWGPVLLAPTAGPLSVAAGSCNPVTVQARDQSGAAANVTASIILGLTSSSAGNTFHSDASCAGLALTSATMTAPANTHTVYFRDTTVGTPTVTISAPGFASILQTHTINPGPAARLVFTTAPLTVTAGACSAPAGIGVQDSFGNPAIVTPAVTVSLASGSATLSFHAAADTLCATALSPAAISLGSAATAFRIRDTRAGAPRVDATATGLTPATQTQRILAGAPSRLVFASPPQTVVAGACSGPTLVQIEDALGNAAPVAAATTLSLTSTSTGNTFFGLTCSPPTATTAIVPAGSSTAAFHFQDTVSGTPTLTVTGAMLAPASQAQAVIGAAATALVLSQVPATMQATVAAGFQLTARDTFGNVAAGYAGTVSFTSSDPLAALPAATLFTSANAGTRALSFTLSTLGTQSLTATDGSLVVTAGNIQVVAGPATSLAVSGVSSPLTAGSSSDVTVEARDALGNRAVGYLGTVSFSSSDPTATLPPNYAFLGGDLGRRTFSLAVTLRKPGTQSVTATDLGSAAITGAQSGIVVLQGAGSSCAIAADCGSGVCAQGVCCGSACTGACQACNLAGNEGTCSVVPNGTACADPLYCNGKESCQSGACTAGSPVACVDPMVLVCDEASQSCKRVRSGPPLIVRDAILTAAVGVPYAYNALGVVLVAGARPLAFAACGGPAGFKVDRLSGAVSWTPDAVGSVVLCVKATNALGEDTASFVVQVTLAAGQGPTASFTVSPAGGVVPLTAVFDGSASTADASSPLAAWRWDYGDFAPLGTGQTSSWDYLLAGGYQPQLTVLDAAGRSGSAKRPVRVRSASGQQPPLARIVASAQTGEGSLSVDFSCDCQPGDAAIIAWRWDFADTVGAGASTTRVFEPGRYRVHLTAVDSNGLTAVDSVEISVARVGGAQPPRCQALLSPPSGLAPLKVIHMAWARASTGQLASVLQDFVDGGSSAELEVDRQYGAPGRYPVKLTVTDDQGLTCRDSVEAVVVGTEGVVPPRILSLPPAPAVNCGQTFVYAVAAAGSAPFVWSLAGADGEAIPDRVAIDATGQLTWPTTSNDTGAKRVSVLVSNGGGTDAQTVLIEAECGAPKHLGVGCGCGGAEPFSLLLAGVLALSCLSRARRRRGAP